MSFVEEIDITIGDPPTLDLRVYDSWLSGDLHSSSSSGYSSSSSFHQPFEDYNIEEDDYGKLRLRGPAFYANDEEIVKQELSESELTVLKQKEKLDAQLGEAAVAAAGVGATSKAAARRARSRARKEYGLQGAAVPQSAAVPVEQEEQPFFERLVFGLSIGGIALGAMSRNCFGSVTPTKEHSVTPMMGGRSVTHEGRGVL